MTKVLKLSCVVFLFTALTGCASILIGNLFSSADKNKDSYLTFEEFSADSQEDEAYNRKEFKKADTNGDNKISKNEMKAYIKSNM